MPDFLDRLGDELMRAAGPPESVKSRVWYRRRGPALIAVCTALAGGGVAVGLSGRASPGPVPPRPTAPEARTIAPAEASAFAILRRAPTSADVIPTSIPVALSGASGANLALARRAATNGSFQVWVIPGRGSVCILARQPSANLGGAACETDRAASEGQLYTATGSPAAGEELLAGLTPDGTQTVTVLAEDGTKTRLTTTEGVYVVLLHGAAHAVEFDDTTGHHVIEGVGIP